jgi:hypothetical protein
MALILAYFGLFWVVVCVDYYGLCMVVGSECTVFFFCLVMTW